MNSTLEQITFPTMEERLQENIKLPEQLVSNGLVVRENLTVLAAPLDSFKTQATCQLAICLAAGIPWLGFSCKQSEVVYLVIEGGDDYILERLYDKILAMDLNPSELMRRIRVNEFLYQNLDKPETATRLLESLRAVKPDVVIADPVTYRVGGDNRYAPVMTNLGDNMIRIARDLHTGVILVIHTRKGTTDSGDMDEIIGSSILPDMAATRIKLFRKKDEDAATLYASTRYSERMEPLRLAWKYPLLEVVEAIKGQRDKAKETVVEYLLEYYPKPVILGILKSEVAKKVHCNEKTARLAISDLEVEGKVSVDRQLGSAMKLVSLKDI